MDITFRQLEIFRWVVVAGSITKASHRIGLSQPSISQQLAKLEEMLNVQLINRNRTGQVSMTPAGEFWFKSSEDILGRMSGAMNEHEKRFRHSSVVLRLGATPVLRGAFTAATAHIAQSAPGFVKFELVYDVNSSALVEQLRMHQINFAIVSEPAILKDQLSFAVSRLFWFVAALDGLYRAETLFGSILWGGISLLMMFSAAWRADRPTASFMTLRLLAVAFLALDVLKGAATDEWAGFEFWIFVLVAEYAAIIRNIPPREKRQAGTSSTRRSAAK